MAFDSAAVAATARETWQRLQDGRITKIHQPEPLELVLAIHTRQGTFKLLLSAHPTRSRFHLTRVERRNPPSPPMFCMLLRKYLEGGRLLDLRQFGRDRIIGVDVGTRDELGNPTTFTLVAEVMGKHSNLVLLTASGRIVDAARRVTEERNRHREVLPGLAYVPPPATDRLDPAQVTGRILQDRADTGADPSADSGATGQPTWRWLLDNVDGFGPLLARELCYRSGLDTATTTSLAPADYDRLADTCRDLAQQIDAGQFSPRLLYDEHGQLRDYAAVALRHWPGTQRPTDSMSDALDRFYIAQQEEERRRVLQARLERTLNVALARLGRKAEAQARELADAEDADRYRIMGELLLAQVHAVPRGTQHVHLANYYEPDGAPLLIPLDPALGPAENAKAYFRRYQKAKNGLETTRRLLTETRSERAYLEQVQVALAEARALPELAELERELIEQGYLDAPEGHGTGSRGTGSRGIGSRGANTRHTRRSSPNRSSDAPAPPLVLTSSDGLEIWVGRNNKQNDRLTLRLAAPTDWWFHTKEIPGAHVILRVPPGTEPPVTSVTEAAALAAYHSKARLSGQVPVDCTECKHVRKPAGARPGMVIYDHQRTLFITPDPDQHPILRSPAPETAAPDPS